VGPDKTPRAPQKSLFLEKVYSEDLNVARLSQLIRRQLRAQTIESAEQTKESTQLKVSKLNTMSIVSTAEPAQRKVIVIVTRLKRFVIGFDYPKSGFREKPSKKFERGTFLPARSKKLSVYI